MFQQYTDKAVEDWEGDTDGDTSKIVKVQKGSPK